MSTKQTNNINNKNGNVNIDQSTTTTTTITNNNIRTKVRDRYAIKIDINISIVMIIALVIMFGLNAFLNTNEKKIIGTWQINEQPQILITFGNDGVFSMSGDGDYLDGNYTFLTDNTVQAHMNYMWADFVISGDISISGSKMTISNMSDPDDIFGANGATITLSKTK